MVTCSKINSNEVGLFGNKLFIIAALIGLAKRNNDEVVLPNHINFSTWQYGHCFENEIRTLPTIPQINFTYQEPFFHYKDIPYYQHMDIRGFFQSEKYFLDAEQQVRHFFEPKKSILERIKQRYPVVFNEECTSIHVRRNDYLAYQDTHPSCTPKYYIEAMKVLPKTDKYVIFSDDIEWCKTVFISDNDDVIFVEGQQNYEDMFLMSNCKNHIIANSSFSWWGSWLNKNKKKQTVIPKKWFGTAVQHDWKDIYPTEGVIQI